jgi:hypothetical protein
MTKRKIFLFIIATLCMADLAMAAGAGHAEADVRRLTTQQLIGVVEGHVSLPGGPHQRWEIDLTRGGFNLWRREGAAGEDGEPEPGGWTIQKVTDLLLQVSQHSARVGRWNDHGLSPEDNRTIVYVIDLMPRGGPGGAADFHRATYYLYFKLVDQ